MDRLRPHVLGLGRPTSENTALFRMLVGSGLAESLAHGDAEAAGRELRRILPGALHPLIGELLDASD